MDKIKDNILIVEDETIIAEEIKEILSSEGYHVIGQASSADEAHEISKKTTPDICFLDVTIEGDRDGIVLGQELKDKYDPKIVFLTAYGDKEHIQKAKSIKPSGYLTKPFKNSDIIAAVEMLSSSSEIITDKENELEKQIKQVPYSNVIFLKDGKRFNKIDLTQVLFVEATGSYSMIYMKDRTFTVALNLKYISAKINSNQFMRVHRSYYVNLDAVEGFEGNTIYIQEHRLPISSNYKQEFIGSLNIL